MNLWSDGMLVSNPIIICSIIAIGIVIILIGVVVICCKRKTNDERDELMLISKEIDSGEDIVKEEMSDDKIESVLSKMQEALDVRENTSVSFEQEQEENAIISYQELLASLGGNSSIDVDSIEVYDDELDNRVEISDFNKEIIDAYQAESLDREIYEFQNDYSCQEVPMELSVEEAPTINFQDINVNMIGDVDVSLEEEIDFVEEAEPVYQAKHVVGNTKFKSSEFISPVYGIMKEEHLKEEIEEIVFEEDF